MPKIKSKQKPSPANTPKNKPRYQPSATSTKARRHQQTKRREIPWFAIGMAGLVLVALVAMIVYRVTYTPVYPPEISAERAFQKYQKGVFVLDVRQPEEWDEYHVPGSTLIPLEQLADRLSELPLDEEIVVVCRSGNRSQEGRDILLNAGFTKVSSMAGGLLDWRVAGYPVE